MKSKVFDIWYRLSSSLWFVPSLMVALSIGLWYGMGRLDAYLIEQSFSLGWIFSSGVEGTRSILSTIAGSIITVAGVVFSITIVVLSQLAGQFGPQLVKSFMQDKSTQIALGIFSATFIYSLLALSSVRNTNGDSPSQAATALALLLALASIGVLIRFIHGMARSVESNRIIAAVVKEMNASLDRVFPSGPPKGPLGRDMAMDTALDNIDTVGCAVIASKSGFLQAVDLGRLVRIAEESDVVINVRFSPGEFIPWKAELVSLWPAECADENLSVKIRRAFVIGDERTTEQDIELSIERLSMIAARALSPSINDTYTAVICLRWLGVMLCQIAERSFLEPYHYDKEKRLRIITRPVRFSAFVSAAFDEIRHSAGSPEVFVGLLENIDTVSRFIKSPEDRDNLVRHARDIEFYSRRKLSGGDLQKVENKCRHTLHKLAAVQLEKQ